MKYIAHRGLFDGPNKDKENSPAQINQAIWKGFDVEVDVWFVDNQWYLCHDEPTYKINYNFLEDTRLWIHAKNLEALYVLGADPKLNFFWHQEDDFTLTSQCYIWTYPNKTLTKNSICVMPEWNNDITKNFNPNCYGVCSDFVDLMSKNLTI
jgi:hypothetical protein